MLHKSRQNGHNNNCSESNNDVARDGHQLLFVDNRNHANNDCGTTSSSSEYDVLRDIFTTAASISDSDPSAPMNGSQPERMSSQHPEQNSTRLLKQDENERRHDRDEMLSNFITPLNLEDIHTRDIDTGVGITTQSQSTIPLTSRLGKRIAQQYQDQKQMIQSKNIPLGIRHQQHQGEEDHSVSTTVVALHRPSIDFLRLPPPSIHHPVPVSVASREVEWSNNTIEDLERWVVQYHLDFEALQPPHHNGTNTSHHHVSENSSNMHNLSVSLLTSECYTRVIERDPKLGLGMSLREYDGCIYVQALLQRDGSWVKENGFVGGTAGVDAGPGARAGILPGDRLLGLNGRPFLKGRLASDYKDAVSNNNGGRSNSQYSAHGKPTSEEVMASVRDAISNATSPIVLHIQRLPDREKVVTLLQRLQNESRDGSKTEKSVSKGISHSTISNGTTATLPSPARITTPSKRPRGPIIHEFAMALSNRGIIQKGNEERTITMQLRLLTDRTRQWESKLSFRLRANDFTLRPQLDARDVEQSYYASFISDEGGCPPFFDYKFSKSIRSYAPSTPMIQDWRLSQPSRGRTHSPIPRVTKRVTKEAAIMADLYAGLDKDDADVQDFLLGGKSSAIIGGEGAAYPTTATNSTLTESNAADIFVPLVGVRKAMCVRILNSFLDNQNQTAFTIWCYDVESGREWYAPVRYYNDFKDLRSALLRLDKTIADIPFPSLGWGLTFSIESGESAKSKELRRSQLEIFLRQVFAHVYRGRLHPYIAEVAVHLQTFVGCDTVLAEGGGSGISLSKQVAISESTYGKRMPDPKSEPDDNARRHLKRSVMRYVYRLFLLPALEKLITNFVDGTREIVMTDTSAQLFSCSKSEARASIEKIRDFIDKLQELVLDGCHDDFISIAERRDFAALVDDSDNLTRDDLFREAVREQIEIEVYVPLRSTISKYLVYAWANEDMEVKHKMKVNLYSRGKKCLLSSLPYLQYSLIYSGIG
jgi:hypothetical protein